MQPLFQPFAAGFDAAVVRAMNDVVSSGLTWVAPQMRWALTLYIIISAFLVTIGQAGPRTLIIAAVRAICIAAILKAANYNLWVSQLFFTTLPNEIAAGLNGLRPDVSSAQQFDQHWSAVLNAASLILSQASGWLQIMDRAVVKLLAILILIALSVMFIMWFIARVFLAIVICLGPFLIPLFLFRATRGFAQAWIGKLVGFTVLQLASSILLRILMVNIADRVIAIQNAPGDGLDTMIANMTAMCGIYWLGAIFMLALPIGVAIGSGMGASQAAAAGMLLGFPGRAFASATRATRAVTRRRT